MISCLPLACRGRSETASITAAIHNSDTRKRDIPSLPDRSQPRLCWRFLTQQSRSNSRRGTASRGSGERAKVHSRRIANSLDRFLVCDRDRRPASYHLPAKPGAVPFALLVAIVGWTTSELLWAEHGFLPNPTPIRR